MNKVDVAVNHLCKLGEGPVWDAKRGVMYWVDILSGEIHQYKTTQGLHEIAPLGEMVGAVALCKSGNLLAALKKSGLAIIDRKTGGVDMIVNPEAHLPQNRYNDGKCDPDGRFWIGTMSLTEEHQAGSVYMLENNRPVTRKMSNVTISNGMAWSPDHQTFYYIDTPTSEVVAYTYNKSGEITGKRTIITIPKTDGYPDGMTIDDEGMLWIAHWNGWQVSRWNPLTGKQLFSLPLPVANVTSCTFGGENLIDLYITTAQKDLSDDDLKNQPLAGALFVWKNCGYKGMPAFEFNDQE
ncbi:SMP-30/gluconolactonase/LRE family protein [Mucilaginibacter sabulilitoris]|uniref:Regucalcin n=1 Tax=Mucilaginibacter sabulilitoris TaxID=1173583 RepID=A0ABZ0TGH2_9SPHI|nr:SMP-30/gluconolactonase/LRE family protein [Mucilaginibacter sabulilitoris]WPU92052.1 SMP-30/gluconolactonase/LRE family protein [Mucilaginibacter sabulilitoris]